MNNTVQLSKFYFLTNRSFDLFPFSSGKWKVSPGMRKLTDSTVHIMEFEFLLNRVQAFRPKGVGKKLERVNIRKNLFFQLN